MVKHPGEKPPWKSADQTDLSKISSQQLTSRRNLLHLTNPFLGSSGFKHFCLSFTPRFPLGKWSHWTHIFFKWLETWNHQLHATGSSYQTIHFSGPLKKPTKFPADSQHPKSSKLLRGCGNSLPKDSCGEQVRAVFFWRNGGPRERWKKLRKAEVCGSWKKGEFFSFNHLERQVSDFFGQLYP